MVEETVVPPASFTDALNSQRVARLSSSSNPFLPYLVVFSAALFFFYEFIQMQSFNAISQDLMRSYSLNASQLGILSTSYVLADTLFLLPAGLILDRVSTRKVILVTMLMAVLSTVGFALTHNLWIAGFCHFIAGLGNAFCFLCCIILASRWFPPQRQAMIIGLVVTIAFLGGATAQTPMALLNKAIGWRDTLLVDAAIGAFLLAIIWLFVRDYPEKDSAKRLQQRAAAAEMGFIKTLKLAMRNKQNWFCGLYTSLLNLPIMVLAALWGGMYLSQVHHISMAQATTITLMIFIGSMIGSPIAGWISDTIQQRRLPMVIGGLASLVLVMMIMYLPHLSFINLIILFFALGFTTSSQVIGYPTITESNPDTITGTAMGLASTLIMGIPIIAQPLFGWLMDLEWKHIVLHHIPVYSASNYKLAMTMFPIAFIAAIVFVGLARETRCKPFNQSELKTDGY